MRLHRGRRTTKRLPVTPFRPEGRGATALIASLLLLNDARASIRRRALISEPSRSKHVLTYL